MNTTTYGDLGEKVRKLRIALGYLKRPEFAEVFNMTPARLQSIEQGRQKMNQDDFKVIYQKWPWALDYLLADGPLKLPDSEVYLEPNALVNDQTKDKTLQSLLKDDPEIQGILESKVRDIIQDIFLNTETNKISEQ